MSPEVWLVICIKKSLLPFPNKRGEFNIAILMQGEQ